MSANNLDILYKYKLNHYEIKYYSLKLDYINEVLKSITIQNGGSLDATTAIKLFKPILLFLKENPEIKSELELVLKNPETLKKVINASKKYYKLKDIIVKLQKDINLIKNKLQSCLKVRDQLKNAYIDLKLKIKNTN
uniref:Uncharacterized protein n=1 Tax=viral metagenome TaxID=1070528 RepID=A0A6C0ACP1_9ZZZZ